MDESLQILRPLLTGKPVSFEGEFFSVRDALIVPAPEPPIPLIVGGRSDAAVRRAGRFGDGWLGIWSRRAGLARWSNRSVSTPVTLTGTRVGLSTRSMSGAASAPPAAARAPLAAGMQDFYQMPFEPFERYSPYGTPEEVADFLHPYIEAGCTVFNVIPCASDHETAVTAVAELRRLLTSA
jgi:alkanesulfonate monooxygenase SsuD/methylene tetrahydromethanopterin reductase-like flavin-dependent oxidoreductase (luciferase family)